MNLGEAMKFIKKMESKGLNLGPALAVEGAIDKLSAKDKKTLEDPTVAVAIVMRACGAIGEHRETEQTLYPLYDPQACCPACGSPPEIGQPHIVVFCGPANRFTPPHFCSGGQSRHLVRACSQCRCTWVEGCLDDHRRNALEHLE